MNLATLITYSRRTTDKETTAVDPQIFVWNCWCNNVVAAADDDNDDDDDDDDVDVCVTQGSRGEPGVNGLDGRHGQPGHPGPQV